MREHAEYVGRNPPSSSAPLLWWHWIESVALEEVALPSMHGQHPTLEVALPSMHEHGQHPTLEKGGKNKGSGGLSHMWDLKALIAFYVLTGVLCTPTQLSSLGPILCITALIVQ